VGHQSLDPVGCHAYRGPNDVWIFQIAQGLTVSSGVQIILAGGALPKNIYWATFAAADLGTTSKFNGVILSQTSIVMKTGASTNGRLMAGTAVDLAQNTVTQP
jgi:Ice-binding-like